MIYFRCPVLFKKQKQNAVLIATRKHSIEKLVYYVNAQTALKFESFILGYRPSFKVRLKQVPNSLHVCV